MSESASAGGAGRVVVQLATLDELENLRTLVPHLLRLPERYELLVVDDDSPDGTPAWLTEFAAREPRVHPLIRTGRRGYASATVEGFRHLLELGADRIVTMDADYSHDPAQIATLVGCSADADLVLGSRYAGGCRVLDWPLRRLVLSVGANHYVRTALRMPFADSTSGFRCYRAEILRELGGLELISSGGYAVLVELLYRLWRRGARIVESPIVFSERRLGRSKMSRRVVAEAVVMPWWLWWKVGPPFPRRARRAAGIAQLEGRAATSRRPSRVADRPPGSGPVRRRAR